MPACSICTEELPAEFGQEHHIRPQAVGKAADNREENLAFLCSGCHHTLHRVAEMMLRGDAQRASVLAGDYWHVGLKRALTMAALVADEMRAMREGERDMPEVVSISVEIPRDVYIQFRIMAAELNGGRPGMQPLLRSLILSAVQKLGIKGQAGASHLRSRRTF